MARAARLSPRDGKAAPPRGALGFYREVLVGWESGRGALRGKELLQAKIVVSKIVL